MINFTEKTEKQKSLDRLRWVFNNLKIESQYGKKALESNKIYKRGEETKLRLFFEHLKNIVEKLNEKKDLFSKFNNIFMELRNISGSVQNLKNNNTLGDTELFEIKNFSILFSELLDLAKNERILPDYLCNSNLRQVINLLNPNKITTRSFFIHEIWSDNLRLIREQKKNIEKKIVSTKDIDEKNNLRNERAKIVALEREEELEIRKKLTQKLKSYENELEYAVNYIGKFELELAKAQLSIEKGYSVPIIYDSNSEKNICIKEAIEPEIAENLKKNNRIFTPVSIEIQKGVTVLTGANMGGKSVALRTIALNAELIRFGFFPFAKEMSLKIPDFIEVISGDWQNTEVGLSSFGAEILQLTELLNKIEHQSGLAVCDELGRSTNPYEGSRFVQALCDKLQCSESYGIIATHYDGIKTNGASYYRVAGLKTVLNDDFEYKSLTTLDLYNLMDYHLVKIPETDKVPHEALKIGILLGLPEKFIESLKKYYNY